MRRAATAILQVDGLVADAVPGIEANIHHRTAHQCREVRVFRVDRQRAQWLRHDQVDHVASLPTTPHRRELTRRGVLGLAIDPQRRAARPRRDAQLDRETAIARLAHGQRTASAAG